MGNDKRYRMNKMTDVAFFMKVSFGLFWFLFYILTPPFLHSFHEWRMLILLLAGVLFILYCALRYYILLLFFGDRKKAFRRQLLENGTAFLGLTTLYILEGFVYADISGYSIPSYRFLLDCLAFSFLGPTVHTNFMASQRMKKNSKAD